MLFREVKQGQLAPQVQQVRPALSGRLDLLAQPVLSGRLDPRVRLVPLALSGLPDPRVLQARLVLLDLLAQRA